MMKNYNLCGTVIVHQDGREPGTWDDGNCTASFAYLCKTAASPDIPNPPSLPKCEEPNHQDFLKFNGFCYKWFDEPKSWNEAEKFCQDQNSHLVSVLDTFEQAYVYTEVQTDLSWLGLNNKEVCIPENFQLTIKRTIRFFLNIIREKC